MGEPNFSYMQTRVQRAIIQLRKIGYHDVDVSETDFYTWMTAEKFAPDTITITDVLASDNLMVHEVVEINEVKKRDMVINSKVLIESPRDVIYEAHLIALEVELDYLEMVFKTRFKDLEQVVNNDPYVSETMKRRARELIAKFKPTPS